MVVYGSKSKADKMLHLPEIKTQEKTIEANSSILDQDAKTGKKQKSLKTTSTILKKQAAVPKGILKKKRKVINSQ